MNIAFKDNLTGVLLLDFTGLTIEERADLCLHIFHDKGEEATPKCSDNFNQNRRCGYICCGYCSDYLLCTEAKCRQVWIDPLRLTNDPRGRLYYVILETGKLVSGSIPCLISEMYDDNN